MADINKREYKDLADAVGMPDETDKTNIRRIILNYERKHPGIILDCLTKARKESKASENKFGIVNKGSDMRYVMELPMELHEKIEAYIPTIFREKKHFRWFVKNFPELRIPEKY